MKLIFTNTRQCLYTGNIKYSIIKSALATRATVYKQTSAIQFKLYDVALVILFESLKNKRALKIL